MPQVNILDDLLSSDPNQPATNGVVLLFRAETKSEFKALRSEVSTEFKAVRAEMASEFSAVRTEMSQGFERVDQRFNKLENSVEFIAQQVALLLKR